MKKFFLITTTLFFLFSHQSTIAQVTIEESPYIDQQIEVPIADKTFAEYLLRSQSKDTYLLVDTCDMQFVYSPTGIFSAQSLRRIQLFVDGELRMMQMFLPNENHWQFYPNEYLGFPYGDEDSTLFTFVADIPDTTASFPDVGESIATVLSCRYHFANNTGQSYQTEQTTGQTLYVYSSISGIEEIINQKVFVSGTVGNIFVFDAPLWITDLSGRVVAIAEENGTYSVSPGVYMLQKKIENGIYNGKVIVY